MSLNKNSDIEIDDIDNAISYEENMPDEKNVIEDEENPQPDFAEDEEGEQEDED